MPRANQACSPHAGVCAHCNHIASNHFRWRHVARRHVAPSRVTYQVQLGYATALAVGNSACSTSLARWWPSRWSS